MTNEQFDQLMHSMSLLAIELRETKTLVINAIAEIGDFQVRIEAVNQRFDE